MEKLPLTGFDKVFKPELRCDATPYTFIQTLVKEERLTADFDIVAESQKDFGTLATVIILSDRGGVSKDLIRAVLGQYSVKFQIEEK